MLVPYEQQRFLDILDYWHKVEFFIPYALDQRISELEEWQSKKLFADLLQTCTDSEWRRIDVPDDKEVCGFNLYLCVFDKAEIASVCQPFLGAPGQESSAMQAYEEEARTDLEGETCFAKIRLDREGHPILDSISISTAPWALGQTVASGLKALGHSHFESAKQRLKDLLDNFLSGRGDNVGQALGAAEVICLQRLLCDWAGFTPAPAHPIAVLEARVKSRPAAGEPDGKPSSAEQKSRESEDDEDDEEALEEIEILNSFYIRDIERVIDNVRAGSVPQTLQQYLMPLAAEQRVDLYGVAGREAIYRALQPQRINAGHWLASPEHPMSLMQQFAINTALEDLSECGLFAVNGPPGTGKTTLLRDLFADNIVRRARVLAGLSRASDAFVDKKLAVSFKGDQNKSFIRPLIDELTGFEMVVASSNNAAVENISVALAKRKELDVAWQSVGYLQPVAHNFAVQVSKKGPFSPEGNQVPWGLVSCALGNSKNRKRFTERLVFKSFETKSRETPLTLWEWLKKDHPYSFEAARQAFQQADADVRLALAERSRLAELSQVLSCTDESRFLAEQRQAVEQARSQLAEADAAICAARKKQQDLRQSLAGLREEQQLIDRIRPGWWARLFRTRAARAYSSARIRNAHSQLDAHARSKALGAALSGHLAQEQKAAATHLQFCEAELDNRLQMWHCQVEEYAVLERRLGRPVVPRRLDDLESDAFQKNGLWHDLQLATLRSRLFASALELHQAWLFEVGKEKEKGPFRANIVAITKLLNNKKPTDPKHYLPIWQSLFMIVPVASTTFASFANQFGGLGPGSLGWLFIDEAGQAVPQAAVGALWRAKRCVVVGDPLQIEPVFTLPSKLISALGGLSPYTAGEDYAPNRVSVQRLADQASRFGAFAPAMDERLLWIGSPLRVHRRCYEPMFSLANSIAYADKMVFGLAQRQAPNVPLVPLPSCWVDIRGPVARKQVVNEQIDFLTAVIVGLYRRDGKLPELYVISPFKAVCQALRQTLIGADWQALPPKRAALRRWMNGSIGTVHTFQGKEQNSVFMLLGVDSEHPGSAQWAASKPNLLNVAATRAKHRLYLVGDYELWGSLPYFEKTVQGEHAIPRKERHEFMLGLEQEIAST
ncbi:DEAD/DEAH box helicase [Azotobacter armeniacus]